MTRRPHLDERDPAEPREWQPVSHAWSRRAALEATQQAVNAAKDNRKKPATPTGASA